MSEESTPLYDSKGYPIWMKMPIEFWIDEDVLDFIRECCKEDDS